MKPGLLLYLFMLCVMTQSSAIAQYKLDLRYQVDTPATFISTDNLDNVYIVTQKNQLLKFRPDGKLLWNYSNKAFGKLAYINTTDPMRILLFYPALQQVVVLNNNLNEITRFNFGQDGSRLVTLIATANSNGYWVYDQQTRQLQRLGTRFENETGLSNAFQLSNYTVQPTVLQASDQHVYLFDPLKGILQFDQFGNFMRVLKTGAENFQAKNNQIFFLENNEWDCYRNGSPEKVQLYKFDEKVLQVSEGAKALAVLTRDAVKVYSIADQNEKK